MFRDCHRGSAKRSRPVTRAQLLGDACALPALDFGLFGIDQQAVVQRGEIVNGFPGAAIGNQIGAHLQTGLAVLPLADQPLGLNNRFPQRGATTAFGTV